MLWFYTLQFGRKILIHFLRRLFCDDLLASYKPRILQK